MVGFKWKEQWAGRGDNSIVIDKLGQNYLSEANKRLELGGLECIFYLSHSEVAG